MSYCAICDTTLHSFRTVCSKWEFYFICPDWRPCAERFGNALVAMTSERLGDSAVQHDIAKRGDLLAMSRQFSETLY